MKLLQSLGLAMIVALLASAASAQTYERGDGFLAGVQSQRSLDVRLFVQAGNTVCSVYLFQHYVHARTLTYGTGISSLLLYSIGSPEHDRGDILFCDGLPPS